MDERYEIYASGEPEKPEIQNKSLLSDVNILNRDIVICGIKYLREHKHRKGKTVVDYVITAKLEKGAKTVQFVSNHGYVRKLASQMLRNKRPIRCRIVSKGSGIGRRYHVTDPSGVEET